MKTEIEWIPVENGLPDERIVLVQFECGGWDVAEYDKEWCPDERWREPESGEELRRVAAWAKIPNYIPPLKPKRMVCWVDGNRTDGFDKPFWLEDGEEPGRGKDYFERAPWLDEPYEQ